MWEWEWNYKYLWQFSGKRNGNLNKWQMRLCDGKGIPRKENKGQRVKVT